MNRNIVCDHMHYQDCYHYNNEGLRHHDKDRNPQIVSMYIHVSCSQLGYSAHKCKTVVEKVEKVMDLEVCNYNHNYIKYILDCHYTKITQIFTWTSTPIEEELNCGGRRYRRRRYRRRRYRRRKQQSRRSDASEDNTQQYIHNNHFPNAHAEIMPSNIPDSATCTISTKITITEDEQCSQHAKPMIHNSRDQ